MEQSPEQIESVIDKARQDLRSNFEELQSQVRSATDWRQHVERRPGAAVAVAFGAGALLALSTSRRRRSALQRSVDPVKDRFAPLENEWRGRTKGIKRSGGGGVVQFLRSLVAGTEPPAGKSRHPQ